MASCVDVFPLMTSETDVSSLKHQYVMGWRQAIKMWIQGMLSETSIETQNIDAIIAMRQYQNDKLCAKVKVQNFQNPELKKFKSKNLQ